MQKMMKRMVGVLVALMVGAALLAGTAGAHLLTVENRGAGTVHEEHWVGGNGAAHGKGLVTACNRQKAHGHSAARIDTPWNPAQDCTHGAPPPM